MIRTTLRLAACLVAAALFAAPARAATFTVNSTADPGDGTCDASCTLRDAILAANANGSGATDLIQFNIAAAGPHLVSVTGSALPNVTTPTTIDAVGEAVSGNPGVQIDGSALASGDGILFSSLAPASTVSYLSITNFPFSGVAIAAMSNGTAVKDCWIGIGLDGTTAGGNDQGGIRVAGANVVIGTTIFDGNVISANGGPGILLQSSADGASIKGNYIGTDVAGTTAKPNATHGISAAGAANVAVGGSSAILPQGNVIAGNGGVGITNDATSHTWTIMGNNIGLDATGAAALGNAGGGIGLGGDDNVVGSSGASGRNAIAANGFVGIAIGETSDGTTILGNNIGTNGAGTAVAGTQPIGIRFYGTNCTIGGASAGARNLISGNTSAGITFESTSSGCTVSGNYIGTNAAGDAAIANGGGISLGGSGHLVGGDSAGERNVISGNTFQGVSVYGTNHAIRGNYIGLNAAGTAALANASGGIRVLVATGGTIGGTSAGEGNAISGNGSNGISMDGESASFTVVGNTIGLNPGRTAAIANGGGVTLGGNGHILGGSTAGARNVISGNTGGGVGVNGTNHAIKGNFIGTDGAGTAAIANGGVAMRVLVASGIQIGGPLAGEGNLISGNSGSALSVEGGSSGVVIRGNKIGTNLAGTAALPNGGGVGLGGSNNTLGGPTALERNLISGNPFGGVGIYGTGQVVLNNYIGTNAAGTSAIGNGGQGIRVLTASECTIANNLISGNTTGGIGFDGDSSDCLVQGNKIGTNAAGDAAIPNGGGIGVGGTGHTIGGSTAADRNLVSGNPGGGLFVTGSGHTISGNYIGVNAAGTAALGNGNYGIRSDTVSDTMFGGHTAAEGNVIAGNDRSMNFGYGSHDNFVLNNIIGLDKNAAANLDDDATGIEIGDSWDNTIGLPNEGNVIAGMAWHGIGISGEQSTGNVIQGNWIGTNKVLGANLGNGFAGIFITDSSGNQIGGTGAGEGNVLANNYQIGIWVERGEENEISGNSIFGNYFGIDIDEQGFSPNDGGDGDDGGNRAQNYPLVSSAVVNGGATDVEGMLINEPNTQYRVEFFSSPTCGIAGFGQGRTFRGSKLVTTNGGGQAPFAHSIPQAIADDFLTATVTDPLGNTSEFSPCAQIDLGENPGKIQFDRVAYVGYENVVPTTKVLVTRSHGLSGTATVAFATSNSSALAGSDYTDSDQTLTFQEWEVVKIVEVPILYDPSPEPVPAPEKLLLALSSPGGGATLGTPVSSEIQIWDYTDEDPGLTVGDAFVDEGNTGEKSMSFEVELTATDHEVKVYYLTEEGSAEEGEDYEHVEDEITFPPSATNQVVIVNVPILGDTEVEADEIVWLRITVAENGGNWIAYDTYGRGEVRNDDFSSPPPSNTIFADGFELGTSALWTLTVPTP